MSFLCVVVLLKGGLQAYRISLNQIAFGHDIYSSDTYLSAFQNLGEEYPTDGTAFIFGKDIRSDPKAVRRHVCISLLPTFSAGLLWLMIYRTSETCTFLLADWLLPPV